MQEHIQALENIQSLTPYNIDLGNEAAAQVFKLNGYYILFEIPLFGGEPVFEGCFKKAIDVCLMVMKWT